MTRHPITGVELGRLRDLGPSEAEIQMAGVEALLGKQGPGPRRPMQGLAARYPELYLLTAINPNKGGRKPAAAGIAKAMGLMPDYPDLHLPVTRGPFLSLYVEVKRPNEYPTRLQKEMHALLRNEGHCVVWCVSAQEIVDVFVGYLALPTNGVGQHPAADDLVHKHLLTVREMWQHRLQPSRRGAGVAQDARSAPDP